MAAQETSALTLALVAGGFTSFGVVAKIAYDSAIARRTSKKESIERLAPERRQAYDDFFAAVSRQRAYANAIRTLLDRVREGETDLSDEEAAAFPDSSMSHLVDALDRIRRLERIYSVVTAAEAIVQIMGDMAGATRAALDSPGPNDEITWFLLQRFVEDRLAEFVHGYREDLGLGQPLGAPARWPIVERERPVSLADSEIILRSQIPPKESTKPAP